jgi:hypothetical protein
MNDPVSDALRLPYQGSDGDGRRALSPRTVLRLQQTLGNREVVRLLAPPPSPPLATVELEARPSASATWPALRAPGVVPRVPLKTRVAIAWARMTRGRADEG